MRKPSLMRLPVIGTAILIGTALPAVAQEPFEVDGLVQGCTDEGEGAGCIFYANGARWIAVQGGATPAAVLAAFAALPQNTPVRFAGEILGMGDITVDVTLTAVEPTGLDPHADLRAGLQGDWVSVDDPLAAIRVDGSEWVNLYDGQEMDQNLMTLGAQCADGIDTDGPAIILQMFGGTPEDQTCLAVMDLSAKAMTLIHLPRGNMLAYRRP